MLKTSSASRKTPSAASTASSKWPLVEVLVTVEIDGDDGAHDVDLAVVRGDGSWTEPSDCSQSQLRQRRLQGLTKPGRGVAGPRDALDVGALGGERLLLELGNGHADRSTPIDSFRRR